MKTFLMAGRIPASILVRSTPVVGPERARPPSKEWDPNEPSYPDHDLYEPETWYEPGSPYHGYDYHRSPSPIRAPHFSTPEPIYENPYYSLSFVGRPAAAQGHFRIQQFVNGRWYSYERDQSHGRSGGQVVWIMGSSEVVTGVGTKERESDDLHTRLEKNSGGA
jgi:hypothetical protein